MRRALGMLLDHCFDVLPALLLLAAAMNAPGPERWVP
jgi:hypothetical protein